MKIIYVQLAVKQIFKSERISEHKINEKETLFLHFYWIRPSDLKGLKVWFNKNVKRTMSYLFTGTESNKLD